MRKFFTWLVIGLVAAVAYTFGAKAGRRRYREIEATIEAIWNDPRVKKARKHAVKQAEKLAHEGAKKTRKIGG